MVQRVEAWGNVLEFPDDMSDEDMATAIRKNEAHLNPNASTLTKASAAVSKGLDAGLTMLTPKKSIADQAQEKSASLAGTAAPQVSGVPIRRDYYNQAVAETPAGSSVPDTGIASRVRNIAANDKQAQAGKRTVAKALVSTEPVPEEGGFINSAGRTIGQGIKGAGQVAADFIPGVEQNNAVKQYGQAVIDANPTAVNSLEDIAARPGTAVTEATGNAVPSMAGMVGARAVGQGITALAPFTGPAAPLVAAAGQVVSWLGPAAIAALPSYGGIRDKQILNDPKNEKDAKAIAIATMGAAAVGAIEQAFGPQQWAMAALTKEGRAKLAEKFAAATIPGAIAKGMGKGALAEGSEELAQNPIEQLASFDNPTTPENIKDTLFGGAMGAIGGGVLGGGIPMIAGKPVTEHSDAALRYTAARGGERAKAAAQAELERRAVQGKTNNTPESTPDAVERIIATGREKADEKRAAAPDALESNVLDEENTPETPPEATQQAQPEGAGKPLSILPESPTVEPGTNAAIPAPDVLPQGGANPQISPEGTQPAAATDDATGSAKAKPAEHAIIKRNPRIGAITKTKKVESRSFQQLGTASSEIENKIDAREKELVSQGISLDKIDTDPQIASLQNERIAIDNAAAQKGYDVAKTAIESTIGNIPKESTYASVDSILRERYSLLDNPTDGGYFFRKYTSKALNDPKTVRDLAGDLAKLILRRDYPNADFHVAMTSSMSGLSEKEKSAIQRESMQKAEEIHRKIVEAMMEQPTTTAKAEPVRKSTPANKNSGILPQSPQGAPDSKPAPESRKQSGNDASPKESGGKDEVAFKNKSSHYVAGYNAFRKGNPRTLPSYFREPGDKHSEDWYRGWDDANANNAKDRPTLDLKKQSEAELKAAAEKQAAENKKAEVEKKRLDDVEKKKREQKEIDQRQKSSADNFELGKSAVDSLAGQGDIFSQPVQKPPALDYDKLQTRPGTTERQLEAGRSVYEERLRSIVDRANGSLLGAALAKDFRERGGSELIGKTVKTPQDLAILAQIYRDPRFETFRIFFTKQGKIVHHTGITSRLPGAVNVVVGKKGESPDEASKRLYSDLAKQKKASGADGYYVLHNHPSGRAKPSTADENLTRRISEALPGFLSHVVIDTNEYAAIDKNGRSTVTKKELTGGYSEEASVPHDALKKSVSSPQTLAEIGKLIERKEGFFSVIGLSPQLDVVAIADVPLSIISSKNNLRLHGMLRMFARNSGSNSVAVVADDLAPFKKAITSGVIVDAVSTRDGKSARNLYRHPGDKLFGKNPKSIRVEQAPTGYLFQTFDAPEKSRLDDLIHALQDKHIDLKRVTEAIKATGTQIVDSINAYLQEELFHGRTATRVKEFIDKELDPLIKLMRVNGVKMADFEEYLWARHAEERNIQIAKINPAMPDGGSGMSTKDARDYLKNLDPDKRKLYEALAKRVDAINKKSRQVLVDYGLESQKTINTWEAAYQHYVPLMREDMDHAFGNGTGQGFSVKGNAAKRATGSKRPVIDILANIAQQREKNIIRGEKNRVATALVGLAKTNPNPDFWKVDTPPTIRTVEPGKTVYKVLYHGSVVQEFASRSAAQKLIDFEGKPGYSIKEEKQPETVVNRPDPTYKSRDDVIIARIPDAKGNIQERSVIFQDDPRAKRMALSLKNLDMDQLGAVLNASSAVTRYFSSINTQYNPIFGIVNLTRDVQGAMLNLTSTPLAGKQKAVLSRTGPALLGIYQNMRGDRKGKAVNNQWSQLWEEFQKEGGKTGFRDMYANAKARADALEKGLNPDWWQDTKIGKVITAGGLLKAPEKIIADKAVKPLFDWLSDYNDSMENAVRLAVYKTALEQGLSKQQAASIAKSITVNFNRRGAMGRQMGALYAFFNASVQGTARLAETVKGPAGKRIVAGGILLGGMQAMLLAMAGMDDDEPPEFVKSKSLIIPVGNGKYISVPMPLGFNVLPNLGRITTDFVMSGFKDPGKRTIQMMDSILDAFNPVGNAGMSLQTIAPTAIDPLAALAENKDWTGKPIARQDFNALNPTPGFTRAKDTASAFSKMLSEGLNTLSGGTKYQPGALSPTPDQIDYLISQATGGVGREYLKAEQTVTAKLTGEDLPPHKVPLLGRFYGDTKGQGSQEAPFYENIKRLNGLEAEIKGRMKNREDVEDFKKEHPEWTLIGTANTTEKMAQELRKRSRELDKTDQPNKAELKKQFLERRREIMTRFNEKYKAATAN